MRELENLLKRAVILGSDESIRRELADAIAGRRGRAARFPRCSPPSRRRLQPAPAPTPAAPAAGAPLPPPRRRPGSLKDIARHAAREAERELIYRTLQQTRWNRREAAEILGVSYKALLYKIKEAELDKAS